MLIARRRVRVTGWRNMYEYLVKRGYAGDEHSVSVCIEADNRGFLIRNYDELQFTLMKKRGDD